MCRDISVSSLEIWTKRKHCCEVAIADLADGLRRPNGPYARALVYMLPGKVTHDNPRFVH